jgi:hypothetical protein
VKVYISGPIMDASAVQQMSFSIMESVLAGQGHEPVNPKKVSACSDQTCDRTVAEVRKDMEHSWSCYLRHDLVAMLGCDAVLMLPGWQRSHGAQLEHQVAVACGLKVDYVNSVTEKFFLQ